MIQNKTAHSPYLKTEITALMNSWSFYHFQNSSYVVDMIKKAAMKNDIRHVRKVKYGNGLKYLDHMARRFANFLGRWVLKMKIAYPDKTSKLFFSIVCVIIVTNSLLSSWVLPELFRRGVTALDRSLEELKRLVLAFLLVLLTVAVLKALHQFCGFRIRKQMSLDAEKKVLNQYLSLRYWDESTVAGDALHRIRKDLPEYVDKAVGNAMQAVSIFAQILFCSLYAYSISPFILFLSYCVALVVVWVIIRISRVMPEFMKTLRDWMGKLHMLGWEQVVNREISPLLQKEKVSREFVTSVDQYSKFQLKILSIMNISQKLQNVTTAFLAIGAAIIGGGMVLAGRMTVADILVIFMVLSVMLSAILNIPSLWVNLKSTDGMKKRILEIVTQEARRQADTGNTTRLTSIDCLEFKNVICQYPNSDQEIAFSGDLKMNKGDIICLKGESGSGKSTVFRLMMRLMPMKKGIYTVNGVQQDAVERRSFWSRVLYLQQEPQMMNGSILDNITMFCAQPIDRNSVDTAIEKVGMSELIRGLDKQLDTNMSELSLSSGELQRLCLARIFVLDFDLLLMDEPTAKIDPFSEKTIVAGIVEEVRKSGKLCIVSAHNSSFDSYANEIVTIGKRESYV